MFRSESWKSLFINRSPEADMRPSLRIVDPVGKSVVRFPVDSVSSGRAKRKVVAEISTKRFPADRVEVDKFATRLEVTEVAPAALLTAISEVIGKNEELSRAVAEDDAYIFELRLRAV